jgi:endogenous inhibitor of DNA gyrase (YacG/DUF329 family)
MGEAIAFKPRRPCPVCRRPSQPKYHPFCSARCADVDLGRWLGGHYAVPAEDEGSPPPGDGED